MGRRFDGRNKYGNQNENFGEERDSATPSNGISYGGLARARPEQHEQCGDDGNRLQQYAQSVGKRLAEHRRSFAREARCSPAASRRAGYASNRRGLRRSERFVPFGRGVPFNACGATENHTPDERRKHKDETAKRTGKMGEPTEVLPNKIDNQPFPKRAAGKFQKLKNAAC